jgi:hypothetical protein
MKYLLLIPILTIFSPNYLSSQNFSIGLVMGLNNSFSNYYDLAIDPQKTFTTHKPIVGVSINYEPFKKRSLFISTGVRYLEFGNTFKVEEAPYFGANEGFRKIQQCYSSYKIPLWVGFKHNFGKQLGFSTLFGGSFLQTNRASFKESIEGVEERTINGSDYELDYGLYFRSINKQTFTVDFGVGIFYEISKKLSLEFSLLQQLGLTPILSSRLDYKVINKTNPFTLLGDAYVTSKGDALSMIVGIKYKMGK